MENQKLEDCLGRITRPLNCCSTCNKDEGNLRCPYYQPHKQLELIEVEDSPVDKTSMFAELESLQDDIYGEQGRSEIYETTEQKHI